MARLTWKTRNRIKPRGYPDRRGMGAQSDAIAQQFVPSESYKAQQLAMAHNLVAAGLNPAQLANLFLVPVDQLAVDKPRERNES